jgi:hypothetical protein
VLTVKFFAGVIPNDTAVAPVNPLPLMTTVLPPLMGPCAGDRLVIVGVAA